MLRSLINARKLTHATSRTIILSLHLKVQYVPATQKPAETCLSHAKLFGARVEDQNAMNFIGTTKARVACFLVFLGHFQANERKVSDFCLYSRTVWSSFMKFGQHLDIDKLHVCTKFRGNRLRDFGFRTQKPSSKFNVKSGLILKKFKYGKKYFKWFLCLKIPFIPINLLLAAIRLFCCFFFFLNLVRSSLKPQNIEI